MPNLQTPKVMQGGGSDSALNQDYVSSSESSDSIEQVDAIETISDKSQHPAPPPSKETAKLDSLADESNQSSKSSEGITFVEKNHTADTAKKAKETIGKIWKKLPKKWLAIGAGTIVAICIVFAVVSSIMSQPLNLDASVTLDDVTFGYPSEWEVQKNDSPDGYTIRSSSNPDGIVKITQEKKPAGGLSGSITAWQNKDNYTVDPAQKRVFSISGHDACEIPIKLSSSNANYDGYCLLIDMGSRVIACEARARGGAPANYLPTLRAIIDSAHVESVNEEITVTYMDGDTIVKEETVYNKGGGAIATPPIDLTKEGYILAGWQLVNEEADVDISGSGNSIKIQHITEDIILQAQWEKVWIVTFTDGNGNVLETETVAEGESATAPKNPSREGFEFDGWSSELGPITGDTTIDAKWKKEYESIPYSELARNPDAYKGKKIEISGRVLQVSEGTSENQLRVATSGNYDDVVMVGYNPNLVSSRVLEDDRVTVYGTYVGIYSYTSVMGATISVPGISAKSIKVN